MPTVRKVSTSLQLPTKPNEPSEEFSDYNSMIYGRKQWGKSTLAAGYPNSINLQFEPFRAGLRIFQVSPKSFAEAVEYLEMIKESDHERVVFDTVDRFYDMLLVEECLRISGLNGKKFDHPQKFGKEGPAIWDFVKKKFEDVFIDLMEAGKRFTLVSHDKKVEQRDRDGQEWNRIEPTCKPAAWKIAQSMTDFVFHVDFLNGERIVSIRDLDNSTLASCNPDIECFMDPQGEPLRRFRIANDKKEAFQSLQDAFDNKVQDYEYVEPAKPLVQKAGLPKKTLATK